MHSWQVGGEWEKTERPDWCNLRVQEIERIQILDRSYQQPRAGYSNPFSPTDFISYCVMLYIPKRVPLAKLTENKLVIECFAITANRPEKIRLSPKVYASLVQLSNKLVFCLFGGHL